jgi:FkbM family methyltransferase
MIRRLISALPRGFRGRYRLLVALDRWLGPAVLRARHGLRLEGFYASQQDMAFVRKESDNPELEREVQELAEDAVFIDIGANAGFYSSLAARRLGAKGLVLSIEPSLREYRRLAFARRENAGRCAWLPVNCALGAQAGVLSLAVDAVHTGVNHIGAAEAGTTSQSCLVWTLDELVRVVVPGERRIALVKLDVEGFEAHVVEGMGELLRARRIDRINVEVTDKFLRRAGSSREALFELFARAGYCPTVNSDAWQYDEVFVPGESSR